MSSLFSRASSKEFQAFSKGYDKEKFDKLEAAGAAAANFPFDKASAFDFHQYKESRDNSRNVAAPAFDSAPLSGSDDSDSHLFSSGADASPVFAGSWDDVDDFNNLDGFGDDANIADADLLSDGSDGYDEPLWT